MAMLSAAVMAMVICVSAPTARGSAPDPGSIGIRLAEIPAHLANDSRAREYIVDSLSPGATLQRRVEVANDAASPVHVDLYSDAASIAHGTFVGGPGATPSDLTTWTTLSQGGIDLPARSTALDTVSIAVPKDAAPGERYGVIWAQAIGGQGTAGITLVNRVGVRVYLWVDGNNPPASDFAVDTVTASRAPDGRGVVQAQVHNIGGRALDMTGTLMLSTINGSLTAGPYRVQTGTTLAPGQSEPVRVTVTDPLADGPWNATFDLRSGTLDKTYQARIGFPHHAGSASPIAARPQTADDHTALIYAFASATVLLSALIVFVVVRRRFRPTR